MNPGATVKANDGRMMATQCCHRSRFPAACQMLEHPNVRWSVPGSPVVVPVSTKKKMAGTTFLRNKHKGVEQKFTPTDTPTPLQQQQHWNAPSSVKLLLLVAWGPKGDGRTLVWDTDSSCPHRPKWTFIFLRFKLNLTLAVDLGLVAWQIWLSQTRSAQRAHLTL